jgi:hypothetical protein
MALPRPTNTGALVSAVLVAILGLAANFYIKLAPSLMSTPSDQETESADGSPDGADAADSRAKGSDVATVGGKPPSLLPTPAKCLSELTSIDARASKILEAVSAAKVISKEAARQMADLGTQAQKLLQLVLLDPGATREQKQEARLVALTLTFRIARMVPELKDAFWRVSNDVVENGDGNHEAPRAAGLQILMRIRFSSPDQRVLLADLRKFTARFPAPQVGVEVYVMIARELTQHGHPEIGKAVLQQGVKLYPDIARSRLSNEMLDLDGGK